MFQFFGFIFILLVGTLLGYFFKPQIDKLFVKIRGEIEDKPDQE